MGTRHAESKRPTTNAKLRPKATRGRQNGIEQHTPDTAAPDYQALFEQLVARANQGERLAIERLKKFLDLNPHIWERAGDLTAVAERAWVELIAGQDVLKTESV